VSSVSLALSLILSLAGPGLAVSGIVGGIAVAALATGVVLESAAVEPRRPSHAPDGLGADRSGRVSLTAVRFRLTAAVTRASRPRRVDDESVALWIEAVAREIRGGASLIAALGRVEAQAPLDQCLEPLHLALERGSSLRAATERITTTSDGLGRALAVIRVSSTAGVGAAIGLDRTAASLRERSAVAAERRAQSAQARLSAQVLTILPGLAVTVMAMVSPTLRTTLMGPVGTICLPIGLGFNLVGWLWMRRILRGQP